MKSPNALALFLQGHEAARFADWPSEKVLATYAAARDEEAFRELLRRHAGHVWAVCRRELDCPGLVEDAFQATFVALVRQAGQIKADGSLVGWLDKAARRAAGLVRKKRARQRELDAAGAKSQMGKDASDDRAETIRAAVAELPDRYRLPITYRYLVGLPPADVARAMGIPEDTGKTRLKRGLQMLREKLGGKGLGIGVGAMTGTLSLESVLTAAAERVPNTVLVATLGAVRGLPVKRGILAAVLGVVTYRRAIMAGFTLAGGMATALVLMPGPQPRLVKVSSSTSLEKDRTMRGSPMLAVIAALGLAPKVPAQTFTKIADYSTPIPNGTGTFVAFGASITISNGTVALWGHGSGTQLGIYTATVGGGPLTRFVDTNTALPNGTGNIARIEAYHLSGNTILFSAGNVNPGPVNGLYAGQLGGGQLSTVVDLNTPIPQGTGNFINIPTSQLYNFGSNHVFNGSGNNGQNGIYTAPASGGPVSKVADLNTAIPNVGGNFTSFGGVSGSGQTVGFRGLGSGGYQGLFTSTVAGAPPSVVVDTGSAIPNGTGNFTAMGSHVINGTVMAFGASGSDDQAGIYTRPLTGGPIIRIADKNTPIPGGSGTFVRFNTSSALTATHVAFTADLGPVPPGGGGFPRGIYIAPITGGPLTKVIASGDTLDGRVIATLTLSSSGYDNGMIAFQVSFTDATEAIYTYTPVPEPAGVLALSAAAAAGCFALGRWLFGGL